MYSGGSEPWPSGNRIGTVVSLNSDRCHMMDNFSNRFVVKIYCCVSGVGPWPSGYRIGMVVSLNPEDETRMTNFLINLL